MSLVLRLKLESTMHIKMHRNSCKRLGWRHISAMDLVKAASSATINLYVILLKLCLV